MAKQVVKISKRKNLFQKINAAAEHISDKASEWFGKPLSIVLHMLFWGAWIGFRIENPPYGDLTLFVSLEAILMSALILNASNRQQDTDSEMMKKDIRIGEKVSDQVKHLHQDVEELKELLEEVDENDK
jgi:uncharacterized membrane protein